MPRSISRSRTGATTLSTRTKSCVLSAKCPAQFNGRANSLEWDNPDAGQTNAHFLSTCCGGPYVPPSELRLAAVECSLLTDPGALDIAENYKKARYLTAE